MKLRINLSQRLFLTFVFCLIHQIGGPGGIAAESPADRKPPALEIFSNKIFVKGFPAVIRITARGPQIISKSSLSYTGNLTRFTFSSLKGDTKYSCTSYMQSAGAVMSGMGGSYYKSFSGGIYLFEPHESRTMLMDLSNVVARKEGDVPFVQIPAGKYKLTIENVNSRITSPPVEVEIREPTEKESEFLKGLLVGRDHVNWPGVLYGHKKLNEAAIKDLSEAARQQLAFHRLYLFVISHADLKTIQEKDINNFEIPPYLEIMRRSLWFSIVILNKEEEKIKEGIAKLLEIDPGLRWIFEDARDGRADFLSHLLRN